MDEVTGKKSSGGQGAQTSSTVSPLLKTSLIASLASGGAGSEKLQKVRPQPTVSKDGTRRKESGSSVKAGTNEVPPQSLIEDIFIKASFLQFAALKTLTRLALSDEVGAAIANPEGDLMTSFVTPLLSFCTEAIKEPPSFHPPLSSKFVGVPDMERALAVLHSKFIQNAYSNRNATQCAPKPWNDRMTEKLGRAYDGSARAKAKRYDQPASSLGTTVSSIVMGALSSASSRSSGNTTVPVSYRTRDSAVPVSTQAPPLPTPRLGRSSFLRSVLSSSNMPTSEQLALATAEALQVWSLTHF